MDNAILAVVGTLAGVVVTATTSLIGIYLTTRHQERSAERQLKASSGERLRAERRSTCVDYLSAYADFREEVIRARQRLVQGVEESEPRRPKPGEYSPKQSAAFVRAHNALQITCDGRVVDLARTCAGQLWSLADDFDASAADFDRRWDEARASRLDLQKAMRNALAV